MADVTLQPLFFFFFKWREFFLLRLTGWEETVCLFVLFDICIHKKKIKKKQQLQDRKTQLCVIMNRNGCCVFALVETDCVKFLLTLNFATFPSANGAELRRGR